MRRAPTIKLDIPVRKELERLSRSRSVAVRLAERSRIVLLAAGGLDNQEIAASWTSLVKRPDVGAIVSLKMASGNRKGRFPRTYVLEESNLPLARSVLRNPGGCPEG